LSKVDTAIMYLGNQSAASDQGEVNLFNQYFHSVFTVSDLPSLDSIVTPPDVLSD